MYNPERIGKKKRLLVRVEEVVIRRVRHQRLLTDVCGRGASGAGCGASLGV